MYTMYLHIYDPDEQSKIIRKHTQNLRKRRCFRILFASAAAILSAISTCMHNTQFEARKAPEVRNATQKHTIPEHI